eukprot:scaffold317_cov260-Pinguiococcus_pyrenoidosus.AAC.2
MNRPGRTRYPALRSSSAEQVRNAHDSDLALSRWRGGAQQDELHGDHRGGERSLRVCRSDRVRGLRLLAQIPGRRAQAVQSALPRWLAQRLPVRAGLALPLLRAHHLQQPHADSDGSSHRGHVRVLRLPLRRAEVQMVRLPPHRAGLEHGPRSLPHPHDFDSAQR